MATTPLTNKSWTDLGTAPCDVQNVSNFEVTFLIANAAPTDLAEVGHSLPAKGDPLSYVEIGQRYAGRRVYARALHPVPASVVVSR